MGIGDDPIEEGFDVPISALEHYSYCPRQCGLIHIEHTFEENVYTVRGRQAHERVDSGEDTVADGVPVLRGIALWSERLGLRGKADLVELRPDGAYPVEYKVGRRQGIHPDLQLCAQGLCLEEMLGTKVPRGAIYYHGLRRRHEIALSEELRRRTVVAVDAIREMLATQHLPSPANDARCQNCSLADACLPTVVGEPARVRGLAGALFQPAAVEEDAWDDA
ncbi:MAG: CRISPR-associated protein Cas4 [Chloroflexi bacterium]|nr:CRISPR-associated protein Cas4 [Chloroflexota bacterium]